MNCSNLKALATVVATLPGTQVVPALAPGVAKLGF